MANWCSNALHISGKSEDIKHFIEVNTGLPAQYPLTERAKRAGETELVLTEPHFCFNALVPTPQAVLGLGFDGRKKLKAIIEEQGEEAVEGMMDGWEWSNKNWGTTTDIYFDNFTLENCGWAEGITELTLCFYTAWNPPISWLIKVAPQFPKVRLELEYAEAGMCLAGEIICKGEFVEDNRYDRETCMKMFGYIDDSDDSSCAKIAWREWLYWLHCCGYRLKRWALRILKFEKEEETDLPF